MIKPLTAKKENTLLTNEDKPGTTDHINTKTLGSGWRPTMLRLGSTAKEEVH
jgi:hypothetical protein